MPAIQVTLSIMSRMSRPMLHVECDRGSRVHFPPSGSQPVQLLRCTILLHNSWMGRAGLSFLLLLCSSCTMIPGSSQRVISDASERRCSVPSEQIELRKLPLAVLEYRRHDPLITESVERIPTSFTWRTVQTAQAIDALSLLNQFELLEERSINSSTDALRLQTVRQEILGRVILAMLEVSSAVAKTSCEIERSTQVIDKLREGEHAQIRQQTLIAIVVGAAAAVASGGLSIADISGISEGLVSAIGGTVAGALGISALYHESKGPFYHPDNVLREVWQAPEVPLHLPPSVWRFLQRPMHEDENSRTYRDEILSGWRQDGRLSDGGPELNAARVELFFGDGGIYTTHDLQRRTQMLDSLRATVQLLNHDLEQLARELMIQSSLGKPSRKVNGTGTGCGDTCMTYG